jgi:hypothetical protein
MLESYQNYINTDNDMNNNFANYTINYNIDDIPEDCFEEFA